MWDNSAHRGFDVFRANSRHRYGCVRRNWGCRAMRVQKTVSRIAFENLPAIERPLEVTTDTRRVCAYSPREWPERVVSEPWYWTVCLPDRDSPTSRTLRGKMSPRLTPTILIDASIFRQALYARCS